MAGTLADYQAALLDPRQSEVQRLRALVQEAEEHLASQEEAIQQRLGELISGQQQLQREIRAIPDALSALLRPMKAMKAMKTMKAVKVMKAMKVKKAVKGAKAKAKAMKA